MAITNFKGKYRPYGMPRDTPLEERYNPAALEVVDLVRELEERSNNIE